MMQLAYDYAADLDRCRPWIEASLLRSELSGIPTHDFEDVKEMCLRGDAQMWSAKDGCIITFITHFPQSSLMTVWLMGGKFDSTMDAVEEHIYAYAKSQGCKSLYIMGRKGWKRKLASRGYIEHATVVTKLL